MRVITKPKVTVILPAHNESRFIAKAIKSLRAQTYSSSLIEIVVVDNNSQDNTADIAKSEGAEVLHQLEGPVGNVRNKGAQHASGDIVAFLDADCVAPVQWVENIVGFLLKNKKSIAAGGLRLKSNPHFLEKYWLLTSKSGEMLPSELLGSCVAMWKSDFLNVGMFNVKVTAGEDSMLHKELQRKNYEINLSREFSVIHLGNAVSISAFLKRQIWHSENYIVNIKSSLNDLVFWNVLLFISTFILFLFEESHRGIYLSLFLASIFTRSIKRIISSKNSDHVSSLPKIYLLDFLYLTGRSAGLLKGIYKAVSTSPKLRQT